MPFPCLPEEGDAGWREWHSGIPTVEVFGPPMATKVLPGHSWLGSAVLPFWCACAITQLLSGRTGCENKAQACWAGSGVPPSWAVSRQSLELCLG